MLSFYERRFQKRKNTVKPSVFFELLGSTHIKALRKHVGEIDL